MTSLRSISDSVERISTGLEVTANNLESVRERLHLKTDEILTLVGSSSRPGVRDMLNALYDADAKLGEAVQQLRYAAFEGARWLHVGGCTPGIILGGASSTNSYERHLMSDEESNVFLRVHSSLESKLLDCFPPERRAAVDAAYANAPPQIVALINRCSHLFRGIRASNKCGGCWYSPQTRDISMDERMNQAEYVDVLTHEMGHFVDHATGGPASSSAFLAAMVQDGKMYDSSTVDGRARLGDLLDDLFNTGACYDRNVTDILSAVFHNDPVVTDRFYRESVSYYSHDDSYWDACDNKGNSYHTRSKEVFANWFSVETGGYRISCDFLNRWFPALSARMHSLL